MLKQLETTFALIALGNRKILRMESGKMSFKRESWYGKTDTQGSKIFDKSRTF